MRILTQEEKDQITAQNAATFIARTPGYYATAYNWRLMENFMETQVGRSHPWSLENFLHAYEYLSESNVLLQRPPEPDVSDEAQNWQRQYETDLDRAVVETENAAKKLEHVVRRAPLQGEVRDGRTMTRRLREMARDSRLSNRGTVTVNTDGNTLGLGPARAAVANEHPELSPRSAEFNRLVAEKLNGSRN